MKKINMLTLLSASVILIISVAFRPAPGTSSAPTAIPDSVFAVFEKACITCHSNDGSGMAKGKLNFDKWDQYSPEKQAAKAADICKELSKSSMPPSGFRKNNPDLVPTDKEVTLICDWSKTLVK